MADSRELAAAVGDLLADRDRLGRMAEIGHAALQPFEGAVTRTLAVLDPFVVQMKLVARNSA